MPAAVGTGLQCCNFLLSCLNIGYLLRHRSIQGGVLGVLACYQLLEVFLLLHQVLYVDLGRINFLRSVCVFTAAQR
jgi:hypothetical protein